MEYDQCRDNQGGIGHTFYFVSLPAFFLLPLVLYDDDWLFLPKSVALTLKVIVYANDIATGCKQIQYKTLIGLVSKCSGQSFGVSTWNEKVQTKQNLEECNLRITSGTA